EVKLEGLNLTQAQLDSLINQLKGITGLREAKIESVVDGKAMEIKIENRAGNVRIEDHERHARHDADDDHDHDRRASNAGNSDNRGANPLDRPQKIERPEKNDKVERPDKLEKIERPETDHGGSGRH